MARLHLMVLTTRNKTRRLWKRISNFRNSNFMPPILSRQALSPLHKLYITWSWQHKNTFIQQAFRSVPVCQTCMCKRGIIIWMNTHIAIKNEVLNCSFSAFQYLRVLAGHCLHHQGCGSSRIFFAFASSSSWSVMLPSSFRFLTLGMFCFRFRLRIELVAFEFASASSLFCQNVSAFFRILPLPASASSVF